MKTSELVYTTRIPNHFKIPESMGMPKETQACGTPLEILAETAGRICYDSYGVGRTSNEYHKHIMEVGHLSVYEHCTFTVEFDAWGQQWCEALMNRPGVFFKRQAGKTRLTVNARTVLEWGQHNVGCNFEAKIGDELRLHMSSLMPQVIGPPRVIDPISRLVAPNDVNEVWVSMWLRGSRGFSHEMVRHGDWTAISQRSTRYVDESESEVCWHPAIMEEANSEGGSLTRTFLSDVETAADEAYKHLVEMLMLNGHDRKQARGAARGVLPNALETQMIFSASLAQWNHIFSMRCSQHADAEIRQIMTDARQIILGDRNAALTAGS